METSPEEISAIFKDIDKNFDNKITFEEFKTWWKMGKDNKMEKMVYLKLKALSLLKKANLASERYGGLLENKYGDDDVNNYHFGLKMGEPEELSRGHMCASFNTECVSKKFEEYSRGLDGMDASKPCFVFRVKSTDADTAAGELEEKIEEVKMMASQIPPVAMILGGI